MFHYLNKYINLSCVKQQPHFIKANKWYQYTSIFWFMVSVVICMVYIIFYRSLQQRYLYLRRFSHVLWWEKLFIIYCVLGEEDSGSGQFSFPLCLLICFFLQKKTENELYVVNARAHVYMCDCYYTDDNHLLLSQLQIYLFLVIIFMHLE